MYLGQIGSTLILRWSCVERSHRISCTGEQSLWCKHTNYELATRSALVVSAPGQKASGQKTVGLVEFVDIYPTLTELCRLPSPKGVEGINFVPLLDDAKTPWKTAAFRQYPRSAKETGPLMGYAMRTEHYRYVEWRKRAGGEVVTRELYDHRTDSAEDINIAAAPENREIVAQLAKQLAAGWKGCLPRR